MLLREIFHNVKLRRFAPNGKRLPSVRRRLRGRPREIREEKNAKTNATRSSSLSCVLIAA
jgi:hypothetical protein